MQKLATVFPRLTVFRELSTTPARISSTIPSVSSSVCTPRCFLRPSADRIAFGTLPYPTWIVSPSSTMLATWRPMRRAISSGTVVAYSSSGSSCATTKSTSLTWRKPSPCTRGISRFTCAITSEAPRIAALTMSTLTPRLRKPWASGSEVWISATSRPSTRRWKRSGTCERKIGV